MPNHVTNIVKMRNISNLPLYSDDDQHEFDFNKIIPMSEDLDVESGSLTDISVRECLRYVLNRIVYPYFPGLSNPTFVNMIKSLKESEEIDRKFIKNDEELHELILTGFNYISNIVKHGYPTWYEWCNINWGTKWNAYDTTTINDNEIEFLTAWHSPDPIFIKLSEMYPYDEIEVTSAYEGDFLIRNHSYLGGSILEDKTKGLIESADVESEKYNRSIIKEYYNFIGFDTNTDEYMEVENSVIEDIRKRHLINLIEEIKER